MKIAFILSQFPCYDEAFILRELHLLAKQMDFVIYSLKKSKDPVVHREAEELLPRLLYVPFFFSRKVLAAQLEVFWRFPRRFLGALAKHILGNLRSPEFLLKGLVFFPKAVYLAKWIRDEKITHLHAYWATYPATVAMMASEITKVPFSFTGHAHDIYLDTTHLKEKMKASTFVSTCTEGNKSYLMKINPACPPGKISVIHHGLDLEKFKVPGKKRNPVFEIISVGTLQNHKGFNYLIQALEILKKRELKFHCAIIGGGVLEDDLRKHIHILGLEDVMTMTGALKQDAVIPYYRKADLLVLMAQPEWHWGIPNVFVEALAAETAVITTSFGSVHELIRDGETGLIVPPKDYGALADAVEKLYEDDTLRVRLIEAGHRLVVEKFDIEKNARAFANELTDQRPKTED